MSISDVNTSLRDDDVIVVGDDGRKEEEQLASILSWSLLIMIYLHNSTTCINIQTGEKSKNKTTKKLRKTTGIITCIKLVFFKYFSACKQHLPFIKYQKYTYTDFRQNTHWSTWIKSVLRTLNTRTYINRCHVFSPQGFENAVCLTSGLGR